MSNFADLEARANRRILASLANATVTVAGNQLPVIYDDKSLIAQVGVTGFVSTSPQIVIATDSLPTNFNGMAIAIGGKNWRVADLRHDGGAAGLSVAMLERA